VRERGRVLICIWSAQGVVFRRLADGPQRCAWVVLELMKKLEVEDAWNFLMLVKKEIEASRERWGYLYLGMGCCEWNLDGQSRSGITGA
jgi:hypothetical protein